MIFNDTNANWYFVQHRPPKKSGCIIDSGKNSGRILWHPRAVALPGWKSCLCSFSLIFLRKLRTQGTQFVGIKNFKVKSWWIVHSGVLPRSSANICNSRDSDLPKKEIHWMEYRTISRWESNYYVTVKPYLNQTMDHQKNIKSRPNFFFFHFTDNGAANCFETMKAVSLWEECWEKQATWNTWKDEMLQNLPR